MSKRQAPKLDAATPGSGIGGVFLTESKPLALDGVYKTHKGLYKMEQPHTQRLNMVLPPQLLSAFEKITEREQGPRSKSAVIEHLMIEYCKEHGVSIDK